jgi:histidinol dehydrogenase
VKLRRLTTREPGFDRTFAALLERSADRGEALAQTVAGIIADVRARGDAALLEYTARFDHHTATTAAALEVPRDRCRQALAEIPPSLREALERIAERVRGFAERQRLQGFEFEDADGNRLGERVTALDRVGLYVPGGRAAYPSSVLMNVVPAKVAGVPEVIMCVPAPNGELNAAVLAAAEIGGVDRIFMVGGAQAVAAMACGTHTIPPSARCSVKSASIPSRVPPRC